MDRSSSDRRRRMYAAWLLMALLPAVGCNAVAAALYVVKGTNMPADFDGLKDRRVVVVCRPTAMLQYSTANVAKDLAREVARRLSQHVRNIEVVDQTDVDAWLDEHTWEEFSDVGKALDADAVVGIELSHFSLYQGQTLYQGHAVYSLRVYDLQDGSTRLVYEKDPPEAVYPPHVAIPTAEKREPEFRRQFVAELAEQIGRHFYAHDTRADFAKESRLIQ